MREYCMLMCQGWLPDRWPQAQRDKRTRENTVCSCVRAGYPTAGLRPKEKRERERILYAHKSHCGWEEVGRVAETHAHDLPNRRDTDAENISSDLKGTLLSKVRLANKRFVANGNWWRSLLMRPPTSTVCQSNNTLPWIKFPPVWPFLWGPEI